MTVLRVLLALAAVLAWGEVVVRLGGAGSRSDSTFERLALGWLAGSVLTTSLVFVALWLGASLTPAAVGVGVAGLLAWSVTTARAGLPAGGLGAQRRRRPVRVPEVVLAAVVATVIGLVAFLALVRPLVAWDAWVNWASRAQVLVVDQGLVPAVHADPSRLPTNLVYPLMLPLAEAWLLTWAGERDEVWVGLLSLLFFVSLVGVFHAAARRLLSPVPALAATALLVTSPRLDLLGAAGLADVPMAALVLATFTILLRSEDGDPVAGPSPEPALLLPAVLCAGLPWLKQEGWVWWALAILVLVLRRRGGRAVASAVGLAAVPGLLWQLFLLVRGTASFAFLPPTPANVLSHLDRLPVIAAQVARHLFSPHWNLLWLLVGVTVVVRGRRALAGPQGKAILVVAAFLVVLGSAFMLSRFEPYTDVVANSVDRLIWQGAPLAWWWLAAQVAAEDSG